MNTNRAVLATIFIFLLALFISLGMWQLRRAEQRAAVYEGFAISDELPAFSIAADGRDLKEHRYRWMELRGRYSSSKQLLLDSMTYQGQAGYHVLTPFLPMNGSRWVLVNRGWVKADPNRQVLPQIDVSEMVQVVRGRIDTLPQPGFGLGPMIESDGWPQVVLFPTFEELEERFGESFFRYQLLLDSEAPEGFVREWQLRVLPPERHVGYAIQWFSFAVVLAVMSVVLGLRSGVYRRGKIGR
jgi:surfeit locus 1 family protein